MRCVKVRSWPFGTLSVRSIENAASSAARPMRSSADRVDPVHRIATASEIRISRHAALLHSASRTGWPLPALPWSASGLGNAQQFVAQGEARVRTIEQPFASRCDLRRYRLAIIAVHAEPHRDLDELLRPPSDAVPQLDLLVESHREPPRQLKRGQSHDGNGEGKRLAARIAPSEVERVEDDVRCGNILQVFRIRHAPDEMHSRRDRAKGPRKAPANEIGPALAGFDQQDSALRIALENRL